MTHEDARFERNPDFIFRRIVDEAVLIPIHQQVADMDCIYTLNEVGALLWQRLDGPTTQGELQKVILDQYEVSPVAATQDLARFLHQMVEIGAVYGTAPGCATAGIQKA